MIKDPVMILAITMGLFLLMPPIVKRFKMPDLIGYLIAGILIGPHGFGLIDRDQTIILLGTVGLLLIMFLAGLEIDLDGFARYKNRSILFGLTSNVIPFILGVLSGIIFGYSIAASILLGAILASHTLLGYPIASRLGIVKNKAITMAVGGTIITDVIALVVLAMVAGASKGEFSFFFLLKLLVKLAIVALIILKGIPIIARSFFRNVSGEGVVQFIFVMSTLFASALLAEIAGVEAIIGALFAGLALNRFIVEHGTLMNRINFTSNAIFVPFFLLSVGMLVDLTSLIGSMESILLAAVLIIFVAIGKSLPAILTGKIYHYTKNEIIMIFGLSIPHASATLAATLVGYEIGILDQTMVNAIILMILFTCIIGPYYVEKSGREIATHEGQVPYAENERPQRILIPIANPKNMEALLDFSMILRREHSTEPLYPLTIVREDLTSNVPQVAQAEKMLGHAVLYAAGAEVPVRVLTRIDQSVSNGILRAIAEEQISTVVVGWNPKITSKDKIFGSILDQLLDQTYHPIFVTNLVKPLNTTRRVVMIIPKNSLLKRSFKATMKRLKTIVSRLGATLHLIILRDEKNLALYKEIIDELEPKPPTTYEFVESYEKLYKEVFPNIKENDLTILLSARKGTTAYRPQLEEIPSQLAEKVFENFVIFYPNEEETIDERGTTGTELPKEILLPRDFT